LPSILSSVAEIAADYDAILLDQFGVLHDGKKALPGAVDCYDRLAALGKKLVVLSNTSRRRAFALSRLPRLGFNPDSLAAFVCSGEQAWAHISTERRGQSALWISWSEEFQAWDPAYMDGTGVSLAPASEADFLFCHGSMALRDGQNVIPTDMLLTGLIPPALEDQLRIGVARGLPMVCANPDLHVVLPSGMRGHMPGLISQRYAEMGGKLIEFGKRRGDPGAFDAAIAELGGKVSRSRVLHVGDSLEHDIAGAQAAGIDSLFVGGGIHVGEIEEIHGARGEGGRVAESGGGDAAESPSTAEGDGAAPSTAPATALSGEALEELFGRYGVKPTYSTATFRW
jgi:ribonucleotide monophosphatase NagD (HAD superfamily)